MQHPKWIQLQLTEKCNLNCTMCYERKSMVYKKEQFVLDITRTKEIIDECSVFTPHYELFGGEPLMYPYLDELLEYIYKKNSRVDIPTNGTLLSEKVQILINRSVENVWVSLDGPEAINNSQRGANSYQAALKGIIALYQQRLKSQANYPKIGIHCVITSDNYTHIEEIVSDPTLFKYADNYSFELQKYLTPGKYQEYLDILGNKKQLAEAKYAKGYLQNVELFDSVDFERLHSSLGKIKEICHQGKKGYFTNPDKLDYDSIKNYFTANWDKIAAFHKSCIFPFVYAEITAKGDVALCHSFYDEVLGNVYQQRFLDIWNNEKAMDFRKSIRKQLLPICIACCSFYKSENMA
jgi:MoaA/NifB/PqqE/SkfB family radical SAM enzyme